MMMDMDPIVMMMMNMMMMVNVTMLFLLRPLIAFDEDDGAHNAAAAHDAADGGCGAEAGDAF